MNKEQEYFIYLLRCYLKEELPKPNIDVDINEVVRLSDIHKVAGIISVQIKKLPAEYQPTGQTFDFVKQVLGKTIRNYQHIEIGNQKLISLFNQNNIDHLIVKGADVRNYYPNAELRTSGDTDIIVKKDQFEEAGQLLINNGWSIKSQTGTEHNLIYNSHLYEIKDHFDQYNEQSDTLFCNPFDDEMSTHNDCTYYLKPLYHLVYLIYHFLEHLKSGGAGVRQLMDICVFINKFDINIDELISKMSYIGLEKSTYVVLELCKRLFDTNISINNDIDEELINKVTELILTGGVFGYENYKIGSKNLAKAISNSENTKFVKLKAFLNLLFPPNEYFYKYFPYARNNHFLLPIAYIQRFFKAVFKRRKQNINSIKEINANKDKVIELLEIVDELEI